MTTTPTPKRPWRRRIVTRPRPDVVVAGGTPLAQLTIYSDHLLLARRRRSGAWMQYPVTPEAVAQALGDLPRSSGLLPPGTIAAGSVHGKPFLVRWRPPGTYTLRTERQLYTIPLPPLVWAGCGTEYRIFAFGAEGREWPTDLRAPLYAAPMPNTYATGTICWGSSDPRPEASPAGLARAWKVFEESAFNTHVANGKSKAFPNNVMTQWDHLLDVGAEAYPLDDLEPTRYTLSWLCSGGPWTGDAR